MLFSEVYFHAYSSQDSKETVLLSFFFFFNSHKDEYRFPSAEIKTNLTPQKPYW